MSLLTSTILSSGERIDMVSGTTLFWRLAVLVLALLPVVLADDNLFAGCYSALPSGSDPPATGGATRPNSDACMVSVPITRRRSEQ